jgi:hypothetical protein
MFSDHFLNQNAPSPHNNLSPSFHFKRIVFASGRVRRGVPGGLAYNGKYDFFSFKNAQ